MIRVSKSLFAICVVSGIRNRDSVPVGSGSFEEAKPLDAVKEVVDIVAELEEQESLADTIEADAVVEGASDAKQEEGRFWRRRRRTRRRRRDRRRRRRQVGVCPGVTLGAASGFEGTNVAAHSAGAVAFASGSLSGYCNPNVAAEGTGGTGIHCFHNIIDGQLGNSHSWIPGNLHNGKHFVGVRFASSTRIKGLRVSRKGEGDCCNDRIGGTYSVQYTVSPHANHDTSDSQWCAVGTFTRSSYGFLYFVFSVAIEATALRIVVSDPVACIDELEVYREALEGYWLSRRNAGNGAVVDETIESEMTRTSGGTVSETEQSSITREISASVEAGFPIKFASVNVGVQTTLSQTQTRAATRTITHGWAHRERRITHVSCPSCGPGRVSLFQWVVRYGDKIITTPNYRCQCGSDGRNVHGNYEPECAFPLCGDAMCTRENCTAM